MPAQGSPSNGHRDPAQEERRGPPHEGIVTLKEVRKSYGDTEVLRGISMEVEKGELSQVPIEPMTEQYAPLGLGKLLEEKFIRFRRTKIGEQCFPPYITEHGG